MRKSIVLGTREDVERCRNGINTASVRNQSLEQAMIDIAMVITNESTVATIVSQQEPILPTCVHKARIVTFNHPNMINY